MANTTRDPTASLAQSAPGPAPDSPRSGRSQLTSIATAGLSKSLKRPLSPSTDIPSLTGAAAMADQRKHDEEMRKQDAQMKSANEAAAAKMALMGNLNQPLSRPTDAPPATSSPARDQPTTIITNTEAVAEPMQMDEGQASPLTMSPTTTTPQGQNLQVPGSAQNSNKLLHPDDRSNKAMTYPPPPSETQTPSGPRNMSLPGSSSSQAKSPSSAKKHKCPHCSTEFTRHHNLKSHLLTHSQEKPFGCQQCSSRFRRLHDLKRHLKLHTGERPHVCNICGRKFARGDALARHSKGPGGCAGRRGSTGDDGEDGLDDSMEGVVYPEHEGDSEDASDPLGRRRSEPNKFARRNSGVRQDSVHGPYHHSSTYPPVAPGSSQSRNLYPPPPQGSSPGGNGLSNSHSSQHLSPKPPSFSSNHFANSSVFSSHNGMTESPKPLSPGQHDPHRPSIGSDPGYSRGRSPSLTAQFQQQHLRTERGTPPMGALPPPNMSHAPQLPSLPGLAPEPRHSSYSGQGSGPLKPPPVMSSSHSSNGPSHPNPRNGSHHSSSGSSIRDVLGVSSSGQPSQPTDSNVWELIRNMERRQEEMLTKMQNQEQAYEARIQRLQEEINVLRGGQQPSSTSGQQSSATQQTTAQPPNR